MVNSNMKKLSVFSLIVSLLFILSCEDKVEKDTTPPELTIVSPTFGSTIGEIVQIKVQTTDESGILKVDFYIQNSMVFSDTTLPYEYEWNTTTNQDGEYKVKVISYDTKENFVESEFSVTVDNESKKPSPLDITSVEYDLEKMTVKWNQSQDSDFKQYNLHYSDSENGTKTIIRTISDKSTTSFDTTTFDPTKENWYFLEVVDFFGLSSIGKGKTNTIDLPPIEPILTVSYKSNEFIINWSENKDTDFSSYILYESLSDNMNSQSKIVQINSRSDTTHIISDISDNERRYYQIVVQDIFGLKNQSNIVLGNSFQKIGFVSSGNDIIKSEICSIDIDGQNKIKLTNNSTYDRGLHYSTDGSKIVFMSDRNSNQEIFIMNVDGSNQTNLTNDIDYDWDPKISPDGNKIVFVSDREWSSGTSEIYIMDIDGKNQTNLTNNISRDIYPGFFPDGSKIYFESYRDDFIKQFMMDIDGSNQIEICRQCSRPSISPDGSKIIYSSGFSIFIMDIDGTNKTQLTNNLESYSPVFSPDGSKILMRSSDGNNNTLYIMNVDGTNKINLNVDTSLQYQFSPDGSKIVFVKGQNDSGGIHLINVDGTDIVQLTDGTYTDNNPQFQPR